VTALPCPVCRGPVRRTVRRDAPAAPRSSRRAGAPRHLQIACPRCRYKLYEYPRLCVGFLVTRGDEVLVLTRGHQPRRGYLDLPGGFLEEGEDFERAARRELFEETALRVGRAELLGTYWDRYALPGFGSFPTLNYYYVASWRSGSPRAGDDAAHAEWVPIARVRRRAPRFAWRHMRRVLSDLMKKRTR
jgi:8-oxo-dGTP diphosphatase